MKYKGYEAVIEYDEVDRLFFGRVINTKDIIAILRLMRYSSSNEQTNSEYLLS